MMKTLLLLVLLLAAASPAYSQGQLIFANNSTTTITNLATGLPASTATRVGLYIGDVGDSVNSLTMIGNSTNCFTPGRFSGGTRTLAGWTGTVQLQVRAWLASTVYPSYEAAIVAAWSGDFSVIVGVSSPFTMALTQSPTAPVSIANAGLTPIIIGTPEPSSLALGGLALGALLLGAARRRPGRLH